MKSKVFELNKLLSELEDQGGYFIDFISTRDIQAGIIRLHPGENDTQEPHSVDEVYYVIEGNGFIELNGKDHEITQGTSLNRFLNTPPILLILLGIPKSIAI